MVSGETNFLISVVVYAELQVKPLRDDDVQSLLRIGALMASDSVDLLPVSADIAGAAARLRARLDLALPDSIVVASAVWSRCDALIGNDKTCARRVTEIPYIYLDEAVTA
jgi:predicted nucleic acid-binding protein